MRFSLVREGRGGVDAKVRGVLRRSLLGLFLLATSAISCGAKSRDPSTPTPALAATQDSAQMFGILRRRWASSSRTERIALEEWVTQLREIYKRQDVAHVADVYLAWIALEKGDLERARRIARETETWNAGNVHDLATLLEGAALSREGVPEGALAKLMPLVGKLIDPFARELLHEESVRAATEAARWSEDIELLDDWLRDAAEEEDRKMILLTAQDTLTRMPAGALERALVRMREDDDAGSVKHSDALEKLLATRLATIAIARGDKDLARRLLAQAGALASLGSVGSEVVELASSGLEVPQIDGRRVGLLLPTSTPALRARADDMSLGVLSRLALLGGDEHAKDHVVVRDDSDSATDLNASLRSLTTSGAAVIVGGLSAEESRAIAEFAESAHISAILLTPPSHLPDAAAWTFLLSPDVDQASSAVIDSLASHGARTIAVVGSTRALAAQGSARVLPSADCATFAKESGVERYPLDEWRAQGVDALLLAGDTRCTEDVLTELRAKHRTPRLGLGVEAALLVLPAAKGSAPGRIAAVSAIAPQMGCFPADPNGSPNAELSALQSSRGVPISWWTVLGMDAAAIATGAMAELPDTSTKDTAEVAKRRELVRAALAKSDASPCLHARARVGRTETAAWTAVQVGAK